MSLESYIKKRTPSLYPIEKFCTLGSRYLNKEFFLQKFLDLLCGMFLFVIRKFILAFEEFFGVSKYFLEEILFECRRATSLGRFCGLPQLVSLEGIL